MDSILIKRLRSYFNNLPHGYWYNILVAIGLTIVIIFYILQIGYFITDGTICLDYGFDYCAFWSAGKIIHSEKFIDVYNPDILLQYQKQVYDPNNLLTTHFQPVEAPYLPIFVIPFSFFSLFRPNTSYLIWALLNVILLVLYLRFFTNKITGTPISKKILFAALLSFPVFINMVEGQLNVWLLICAGEYLRAAISGKPFIAGLWLGGWLLKPQLLVLMLPLLLISRSFKILKGFVTSSLLVVGSSFLLIGIPGFLNLINLLSESAAGRATSASKAMINWRMLGEQIASLTSQTAGNIIMIAGSLITAGVAIYVFRKKISNPNQFMIASLGIFSATCVVTWHSHMHMSIIIIPSMLYLLMKEQFNKKLFTDWVLIPTLCTILGIFILSFGDLVNINLDDRRFMAFLRGFPGFAVNLVLLGWVIKYFIKERRGSNQENLSIY